MVICVVLCLPFGCFFSHANWFEYFEHDCYGDELARFILLVKLMAQLADITYDIDARLSNHRQVVSLLIEDGRIRVISERPVTSRRKGSDNERLSRHKMIHVFRHWFVYTMLVGITE